MTALKASEVLERLKTFAGLFATVLFRGWGNHHLVAILPLTNRASVLLHLALYFFERGLNYA